jgi:hypothetical protein
MSDNLISKEKLFNSRPEWLNENMPDKEKSTYNKGWNACNNLWLDTINEQPTAYDVEAVCKELFDASQMIPIPLTEHEYREAYFIDREQARDIVRKGGKHE